jgi:lysozyme
MNISNNGLTLIKAFENCDKPVHGRPGFFTTYRDEVNVLTIGWGHTNLGAIPPHIVEHSIWSQQQCDQALQYDMGRFVQDVLHATNGIDLTQNQFDALISFDFNTGALYHSSIPTKLRAANIVGAMASLLAYNHAGGRVLAGLTRRRKAERLLFLGQVNAALKLAKGN